jgi:hypothetical protein
MGGPRRTPSPLPGFEPAATSTEQPEPRRNIVQRFAQRHRKEPKPSPTRYDIERPEEPPMLDRRPSRRPSAPMEPIPEAQSPRPSADIPERRVSEHPNEPIFVKEEEEPTPVVQRNARPPSPSSTEREPSKTHEPSPEPILSRQPSLQPEKLESPKPESTASTAETTRTLTPEPKPKTPEPNVEPSTPVQRSASLPSEGKTPEAAPPTEPASRSEPDTSPNDKPSLLKRIRTGFHHDNAEFKAKANTLF